MCIRDRKIECREISEGSALESTGQYYRVEDVEKLLQSLAEPAKLTKIIKAYTFNQPIEWKDILK